MSPLFIHIATLFYFSSAEIITPVSDDGINQLYDTSDTELYSSKEIICTTSICEIICDIQSGCVDTTIDASQSDRLILTCIEELSCERLQILNPPISYANITCNENESCGRAMLNLNTTSTIDINCIFDRPRSTGSGACEHMLLKADYANDVTIICEKSACDSADFYVENAEIATFHFIGHNSGISMAIYGSNIQNSLTINCDYSRSCAFARISCPLESFAECNVNCNTDGSCMDIRLLEIKNSAATNLNLECNTGMYSCTNVELRCADNSGRTKLGWSVDRYLCSSLDCCPHDFVPIHSLYECDNGIDCNVDCLTTKCINAEINALDADSLTIDCGTGDERGCGMTEIICPQIGECTIKCDSDYACNSLSIKVSDSLNIECSHEYACNNANFDIIFTSDVNSINIYCQNEAGSRWSSRSACYSADFNINTLPDITSTTSVNIECDKYDCYWTNFYLSDIKDAVMNCNGYRSCYGADIVSTDVTSLQLNCKDEEGCYNTDIYCPYNNENICKITCDDYTKSCYHLDIIVDDSYYPNYLDIECPSNNNNYKQQCDETFFHCYLNGGADKQKVNFKFNDVSDQYECEYEFQYNSPSYCCPWLTSQ